MAATLNGSYCLAGGAYSSVYPDRPIRPLPKRPLRSRLSQEAADSILYPPAPPATQLFYNAHLGNGGGTEVRGYMPRNADTSSYGSDRSPDRDHHHHHHHRPYENGADGDSGDEDGPVVVRRSAGFRGSPFSPVYASHPDGSQIKSSSSPSVPDGYDAFENTNNKKKRKIPTSGTLTGHHSSLTADLASMGLASSAPTSSSSSPVALGDGGGGAGTGYATGNPTSTSSGISGSGRGRFGRSTARSSSARNPLSAHTPNAWLGARSGTSRRDLTPSALGPIGEPAVKSDQGIISTAIANAAAFSPHPKTQNNVSLLDQQASKPTPTKTQFTFTCESDSSKGMAMQQTHSPFPHPSQQRTPNSSLLTTPQNQQNVITQATQTSPIMAGQPASQQALQGTPQQGQGPAPANVPGKKTRRSPGTIYTLAARQRKIQQQHTNLHHPPNPEDIWICEFCEYEAIFGHPPEALIRQYEIKDRKESRRLVEKKRLLEKAKMKGRKNKKSPKNAAKHAAAQQPPTRHPGYERSAADHATMGAHGSHGGDYLGHEYDEEPIPIPAPPHQAPIKPHIAGNPPKMAVGTNSAKGVAGGGSNRKQLDGD